MNESKMVDHTPQPHFLRVPCTYLVVYGDNNKLYKNIRDFKIQRRGRQRERQKKKAKGLISKTTTSHVHHTFLNISFPFLHDYDVRMPNFAFSRGR